MVQFVGLNFPFKKGDTAFPKSATDADLIRQSLTQLLLTAKGERVMRPTVGSNAYRYVFEDNNAILSDLIKSDVTAVIGNFEPRVILQNIVVTSVDTKVTIRITYMIRATGRQDQLTMMIPRG